MTVFHATCLSQLNTSLIARTACLKETEECRGKISRLLCKNDFVRADLMFAELDGYVRVLLIVVEGSCEAIDRCHGVCSREECAIVSRKDGKLRGLRREAAKSEVLVKVGKRDCLCGRRPVFASLTSW